MNNYEPKKKIITSSDIIYTGDFGSLLVRAQNAIFMCAFTKSAQIESRGSKNSDLVSAVNNSDLSLRIIKCFLDAEITEFHPSQRSLYLEQLGLGLKIGQQILVSELFLDTLKLDKNVILVPEFDNIKEKKKTSKPDDTVTRATIARYIHQHFLETMQIYSVISALSRNAELTFILPDEIVTQKQYESLRAEGLKDRPKNFDPLNTAEAVFKVLAFLPSYEEMKLFQKGLSEDAAIRRENSGDASVFHPKIAAIGSPRAVELGRHLATTRTERD